MTTTANTLKKHMLAESHRRQFAGEDYQYVAQCLCIEHKFDFESDEYTQLQSAPDPGCDCGFCAKAPWSD